MKRILALLFTWALWLSGSPAWACRVCRPRVQATIHTAEYSANLLVLLLPVGLLLLGGVGLYYAADMKRHFTTPRQA